MKKYHLLIVALVVLLGVVAYEWRKRSGSAHSGIFGQADDLIESAMIATPETEEI